uniref:polysaccharide pyruvyl transferase family protein n=1 Tax=Carnobacterium sp. PL12RED10 TaxID=2592351 RepID=UPI00336C1198
MIVRKDVLHILHHAEMVITSRYHVLVLSIANKVPILSVMKDGVGDKRYYYNKNGGLIQQVFNGLKIDETRLTKRNFTDTFDLVKEKFYRLSY